jgi:hypothetical protein
MAFGCACRDLPHRWHNAALPPLTRGANHRGGACKASVSHDETISEYFKLLERIVASAQTGLTYTRDAFDRALRGADALAGGADGCGGSSAERAVSLLRLNAPFYER